MKFLSYDSPVMVFLGKVANLMILNLLTILCCIPIITAGAAITALYYVTLKMARGEDPYIVRSYFKSFRQNFRQATVIWLVILVVGYLLVMDYRVVWNVMSGKLAMFMKMLMVFVTVFLVLTALYVFPVLSRFENSVLNTLRNAFLMSFMNFPKSIMIAVLHLVPVAAVLATMQAVPVICMLGLSVVAFLCSMVYIKIFKRFEPEEETAQANGEALEPLSFIVEEENARRARLAAEKETEAQEGNE